MEDASGLTVILSQRAPYPEILAELVDDLQYRPGWHFQLVNLDRGQGSEGLTFVVTTKDLDSYHPERGETYRVAHYFIVPAAAYDARSWRRWLLDRLLEVESHEACEFFMIGGVRPYAPSHGPGNDPYMIREMGTYEDVDTRYTGERAHG